MKARIVELESLRGLMALWVILAHLLTVAGFNPGSWSGPLKLIGRGIEAVDVFIILSGFVIWALLDREGESYRAFIVRRLLRLYPVYLVCLVAAILTAPLAVSALKSLPWDSVHNAGRVSIFADSFAYFPAQLSAHLVMLHGLLPESVLPSSPYAFIGQAWSISLEWQFYLVAPVLFWCNTRYRSALPVLLGCVALMGFYTVNWLPSSLPPKLWLFVVGMGSYALWKHADRIPARAYVFLLSGCVMAVICKSPALLIWACVLSALIAAQQGSSSGAARALLGVLQSGPMRHVGKISYSLYLSHMVVLYLVLFALSPYARALGQGLHFAVLAGCVLCLSFVLSDVLHRYVEQPGIRLGKRLSELFDRQGTPAMPAAVADDAARRIA
jgi:peptidoglycan/LPS O-acetylase OafA/YrhL